MQFFDIEVMKGYVYYDLSKLAFNAVEQIKDFHSRIIRIQQYTILLVETVYPTRLLYQYIKALSKSDKLKVFIASKMTYLLTFLDNKNNVYIYKWWKIHGLKEYCGPNCLWPIKIESLSDYSSEFLSRLDYQAKQMAIKGLIKIIVGSEILHNHRLCYKKETWW